MGYLFYGLSSNTDIILSSYYSTHGTEREAETESAVWRGTQPAQGNKHPNLAPPFLGHPSYHSSLDKPN